MDSYDIVTFECRIKALRQRVKELESGEKYVRIHEEHRKDMDALKREVQELKSALAEAERRAVRVRNELLDAMDDVQEECKKELHKKDVLYKKLEARAIKAEQQRDEALNKLKEMRDKYAVLSQKLEESEGKNKKLLTQLNHNFENSSIPSSKAVIHKKIPNNREISGKKPGAQSGHPHHERKKQTPTRLIQLPASDEILQNPDFRKTKKEIVKQLVNISLSVDVTEYHTDIYYNAKTKQYAHAPFPAGVVDNVNYGSSIKAFLYLLNNDCCTSIDKSSRFLYDLSGGKLKISKGMIHRLAKSFAENSKEGLKNAFQHMQASPVLHIDCTNANVNGNPAYVFVCAVPQGDVLYSAREKKGHEGVKKTVAEDYQGILVHDHESTFNRYGTAHQECLAHVCRYLKDSMENEKELTWNKKMHALLTEAIHYRNGLSENEAADKTRIAEFESRYDEIIQTATKEYEDNPPDKYYRDGYNLYKRMREEKDKYLLFMYDARVPSTNNLAERLLRAYKRKQAQATVFRSFDQIDYLCDGMSMMALIRREDNANLYEAVTRIFDKQTVADS